MSAPDLPHPPVTQHITQHVTQLVTQSVTDLDGMYGDTIWSVNIVPHTQIGLVLCNNYITKRYPLE